MTKKMKKCATGNCDKLTEYYFCEDCLEMVEAEEHQEIEETLAE